MKRTFLIYLIAVAWGFNGAVRAGAEEVRLVDIVDSIEANGTYNVVSYSVPYEVTLGELGLADLGLAAGLHFLDSDEIRVFESREVMQFSPLARFWFSERENGRMLFHTGGKGPGEGFVLKPGYMVVVFTRKSTEPIAWVNPFASDKAAELE
ncbi:MAG TPA: hypothetical protein PKE55_03910 [Kiritimatiellia bacterium]|nr:hypothetical protein [Kiritimatiellia bacterium]